MQVRFGKQLAGVGGDGRHCGSDLRAGTLMQTLIDTQILQCVLEAGLSPGSHLHPLCLRALMVTPTRL